MERHAPRHGSLSGARLADRRHLSAIVVPRLWLGHTGGRPPGAFLLGGQVGLLSALLISINNFRDREEDATAGKRTLAARFGAKAAAASGANG